VLQGQTVHVHVKQKVSIATCLLEMTLLSLLSFVRLTRAHSRHMQGTTPSPAKEAPQSCSCCSSHVVLAHVMKLWHVCCSLAGVISGTVHVQTATVACRRCTCTFKPPPEAAQQNVQQRTQPNMHASPNVNCKEKQTARLSRQAPKANQTA
jgi:hypothetical protein